MTTVSQKDLDQIALTYKEYQMIRNVLSRPPNSLELGMFGALWSEHCGYKHSRPLLRLFPSDGPRVLLPSGTENAGAVDIGDGQAIVFKIESHNHPSAIEAFQGAATAVGGIVRDILAMGARPIALLNSLRFGPLQDSRNRHLFNGVVGGISWYGNCIGVPDVGGEVGFADSYSGNPLVNALCVGFVEQKNLATSAVGDEGNLLLLVGSETGRDGIHGASGLASRSFDSDEGLRPAVQVGNPFLGKILIEACLEATASGRLVGIQDLGAAGMTSSIVEAASKSGAGVIIDIAKVHRREEGMDPYDVMLSESQERMLFVVRPQNKGEISKILEKWDLPWVEIGHVTARKQIKVYDGEELVADLPIRALMEPELYRGRGIMSLKAREARDYRLSCLPDLHLTREEVLLKILASPNIASKESVYRQYDHQVQTNTVVSPGIADAPILRIKGTKKGIAISTDGNGRYCYLDPYRGGAIAVAEACRNISSVGATPIAVTDCLNFGDPERPDIYYQLEWCVRGISRACRVLGVPVVSGNVSLYNDTRGYSIDPTPIVGALGLLEDIESHISSGFKNEGDLVVLLGSDSIRGKRSDLAGSEFLKIFHDIVAGRPFIDLELESRVQEFCRRAISQRMLNSCHDCSDGGLAVALAESSMIGNLGFRGSFKVLGLWNCALLGEIQSRIVVSADPKYWGSLEMMSQEMNVPIMRLGTVGGDKFMVPGMEDLLLSDLSSAWRHGLKAVGG